MKTHDRQPQSIREYIAERDPKTAKEIQNEIELIRRTYARRMNENQHRRDAMIGWCIIAIGIAIPVIAAIAFYLF